MSVGSFALNTHAQDIEYTLLAPIPCVGSGGENPDCNTVSETTTFQKYVPGAFSLLIGLAAITAIVRLVWGGFLYITSAAINSKNEGRELIKNSIYGLVLAIGAAVILNTINPNLLNFNLNIESVSIAPIDGGSLNSSGLQRVTQLAYDDLKAKCTGCTIRVTSTTGGTHTPGSDHYTGRAIDFGADQNLTKFITGSTNKPNTCATKDLVLGGQAVTFLWEPLGSRCSRNPSAPASNGDHWHMSIK